jgi:5-hydroxyisourate hydrolase-like protein (transthyretin family)
MVKKMIMLSLVGAFFMVPLFAGAVSGTNVDNLKIKAYTKQGEKWFKASTSRTDSHGVLTKERILPGWYKFKVRGEDEKSGQTLAVKLRMLDTDGKKITEKSNVDLYYKDTAGTKIFINRIETDKKGWVNLSGLSFDTEYKLDVKDDASLSKKDNKIRIKVSAKIDGSDWFRSRYKRTDETGVLNVEDVLPGKYKFKYKDGDRDVALPFNLKARMLNEKGEQVKEATKIQLYAYINKVKTPVGELMTDERGWVTIPGVMTGIKYKIDLVE